MNLSELFPYWHSIIFILFCLVSLIQVFYYGFFFTRLLTYKAKDKTTSRTHAVSVIICARDEAANLAKNLPGSLIQQYNTTHEIIVVDDNSFDDTKYLLEEFQRNNKQLQIVELKQEAQLIPGKKFPLSMGIKRARYEIVLLTDADCIPASEYWIDKMQAIFDNETEIVLGYGAYHKKSGLLNKIIRWETFHTAIQYLNYTLAGMPYMGVGRNLSYKKEVFYRHKGFSAHNHIASGDDDLFVNMAATKTNTKISIDKDTFTLSEPSKTFTQWIKQKNRHYSASRFYKPLHQFLLGLYSLSHFLFYPLFVISLFYSWPWAIVIFAVRFITQAVIFYPSMKKLDEEDLYPWFFIMDIWMFFYYLLFSIALIKKPKESWK
ncbi:MAG: glycosyltransferase [Sphingobacteriales bacterium]|nr:glycosyltransferase [Sphingobacteriales bacterium]